MTVAAADRLAGLRGRLRGTVLEPGDPGWEAATLAFDLTLRQAPALVAVPADADDVATVVRFAADHGLQVAPQRTGHNAAPLGDLDDTILLRTDALQGVEIDVRRRVARVGAGARWHDLVPRASALGLAGLHGSSGDVSIAGYVLGGGVGWYARRHGLACDSVLAIELVTPDGLLRRVDRDHDPELFWALRGGGGSFGVVTALELELHGVGTVHAGMLVVDGERAPELLHAWRAWTQTVPEEVTSVGRLVHVPPSPAAPAALRGRRVAIVDAVILGGAAWADELLAPLRAVGAEIDTFACVPPAAVAGLHMDPEEPVPAVTGSTLLEGLDAAGLDRVLAAVGPASDSSLVVADLRHVGGALRRPRAGHGALATIDAEYVAFGVGMAPVEPARRKSERDLAALAAAVAPYAAGRRYLNLTERPADPSAFFAPHVVDGLRRVRDRVDPGRLMRANHPVGQ